jgi:hypothetical protein
MYDYEGIINNIVMPKLMDIRYNNPWQQLLQYATEDKREYCGERITIGQNSDVEAYWIKIYQPAVGKVHIIDIYESEVGGFTAVEDCLTKAVNDAFDGLWGLIFDNILAQWRLDILNSGGYSDAGLSRVIYPSLATYNDFVNATITEADLDDVQYYIKLGNTDVNLSDYVWRMGSDVEQDLKPHGGVAPINSYGGSAIDIMNGMMTGDVMYLRMKDAIVHRHMPLRHVVKYNGYMIEVNLRVGINGYITNPGMNALLGFRRRCI